MGELLADLMERGLDFSEPRLYVLDGGKGLHAAVKKYAGEAAPIQRCQVHKRRNVLDHSTDEKKPAVARKLNAAYALEDYAAAKQALEGVHHERACSLPPSPTAGGRAPRATSSSLE